MRKRGWITVDNKWTLEEHFSTAENNKYWDSAGEAARNGKALTDHVESSLLDVEDRVRLMDATGIERSIVSLTSPGIQSLTDVRAAIELAQKTNDLGARAVCRQLPGSAVDVRLHPDPRSRRCRR
jgi:hypothetical protein